MDERFKQLTRMYHAFCKQQKLDKIISKIDKYVCGGGGSNEPLGTWNKAAVTSNLCLLIEHFFNENPDAVNHDDSTRYMVTGLNIGFEFLALLGPTYFEQILVLFNPVHVTPRYIYNTHIYI